MNVRVFLADDHTLVREALKAVLTRGGHTVIGEAANGHAALQEIPQLNPDVAILDIRMPLMSGIEVAESLRQAAPKVRIILLTFDDDRYVRNAVAAGVRGYVLKSQAAADLLHAIDRVMHNKLYLSPGISQAVVDAFLKKPDAPADQLSPRERQVLQLVGEGKSNKEVANLLGISVKTAESHRSRLMQKLDCHETATLVRHAIRRGLVQA